ncbi:MAG: signal peptidase I [Actinomycetia bacterium]|nr:signal peptidase I [Actinomycetes bacterium]
MARSPAVTMTGHVVKLVAWIHIYMISMLGGWILVAMLTTGWQPVVLTSGSMAPTIRPGDVLLLDEHPDELLGQRSVITFSRTNDDDGSDGQQITHRIFEVLEDGRYITKGDANPTPDTDEVVPAEVRGVGRLVIPLVGLPVVWAERGEFAPLLAFAITSAAALFIAVKPTRSRRDKVRADYPTSKLADQGVRLVRILAALMIVSQFFINAGTFETLLSDLGESHLLLLMIGALAAMNRFSTHGTRSDDPATQLRINKLELAGDTTIVILLTALSGGSEIGWVLMALPIVEAAVRFRLAGALVHWMVMAAITYVTRLWIMEQSNAPINEIMAELEQLLDQLGVLLLVTIPGAYLAEQLLSDVSTQRVATENAVQRGHRLEHVAEISHEVNRLGSELFETLSEATLKLGFDGADICARRLGRDWVTIATTGLGGMPDSGEAGSGLRYADLSHAEIVVDNDDPDPSEREALHEVGIGTLIRIVLSNADNTQVALRATTAGSTIAEGSVEALRLLCGQATVALQNQKLMSELRDVHDELEHQATHDALTGLPNRARFLQELVTRQADASNQSRRLMVLFLDLNGFKQVNDTHGHEAGDQLLRMVAGRLEQVVDGMGMVARLGGDEFTILLNPLTGTREAITFASQVHASLSTPFELGKAKALVGTSIGISQSETGIDETELLRRADAAMYAAKTKGGSLRTAMYDPRMDEGDRRRGRLSAEFKGAFERNELQLAYQPLIDAATGLMMGSEALLRWKHRELGAVDTATILELAELSGLMEEMTAWIVNSALTATASLDLSDNPEFFVAVNLSPTELESPNLIETINDALMLANTPPHRLVIELSERLIAERDGQRDNINALDDIGVTLSLDDFGEGRTSLAHLGGVPLSHLKLDRAMVRQASTSEADRTILQSVTTLAQDLSLLVVAEGVETLEQIAMTIDAGADLLQGYGLHRPMTFAALEILVAEGALHQPDPRWLLSRPLQQNPPVPTRRAGRNHPIPNSHYQMEEG